MEVILCILKTFLLCAEKIFGLLTGEYTFPEFEIELEKLLKDLGKEICRIVLRELDEKIYKDKKEREIWRVVQKDCERTITTKFGDVTYKRRYYEVKKTGEKAYLVDRAAGIQKYERIDVALKAEITDLSTIMSYERSTREIKRDGAECHISRQTLMNTLRKIDEIKTYGEFAGKKRIKVFI